MLPETSKHLLRDDSNENPQRDCYTERNLSRVAPPLQVVLSSELKVQS